MNAPAVLEPAAPPLAVSEEDRFLFDLRGYLVLRGVLSPDECAHYLDLVDRAERLPFDEAERMKHAFGTGTPQPSLEKDGPHTRLNGLLRLDPGFDEIIDHPVTLPRLRDFMQVTKRACEPQLVNSWCIRKGPGHDRNGWHRGITPDHYAFRNGKICSRMLNTIWFLTDNGPDDGCVIAVPGSHKNNVDLDWGRPDYRGLAMPGAQRITGQAGDVILFSESLLHTGLKKTSPGVRTNLYYNYITRDYSGGRFSPEHNYHFIMPPSIRQRFTPQRRAMTDWMAYEVAIDIPPYREE